MSWSFMLARLRPYTACSFLVNQGVVKTARQTYSRGSGMGVALAGSSSRRSLDDLLAKGQQSQGQQSQGQCRGMAASNHRHKKIIKMAKGYRGKSKNVFKIAIQKVEQALQQAYRDRKNKKRDFRRLWIERINAGVRQHGMSYSMFVNQAKKAEIELNRKVLAEIAVTEPYSFRAVVETVKAKGSTDKA